MKLEIIIKNLRASDLVDAVFLTGSHASGQQKTYSDIDLIVILKENIDDIRSIFMWIDGLFADVFFFDRAYVERISKPEKLNGGMDEVFVAWLKGADIKFDKTGEITALRKKTESITSSVSQSFRWDAWQKINYNFVANTRYFNSGDPLYLEALEIRLQYSMAELITGYFNLRGIPWRGEKNAVIYLKQSGPVFWTLFDGYGRANSLDKKFELYKQMVQIVLTPEYKLWNHGDIIALANDSEKNVVAQDKMVAFWKGLID